MGIIERREEGQPSIPDYTRDLSAEEVARGKHREWVGGRYDTEYGKTQVDFLQAHGLRPEHTVIDMGCGSFRGGRYTIDYLDPNNYYGVDANQSVMQAGYDHELTDEQRAKVPTENLRANERFDADFGVKFDYGIAQSVFTHVSLNHVRLCLYRLAKVMEPGAKFYATFFEQRPNTDLDFIRSTARGKQKFSEQNVFWYYRRDMKWAASFSPWKMNYIGDWGQPAGQKMIEYIRIEPVQSGVGKRTTEPTTPSTAPTTPRTPANAESGTRGHGGQYVTRGRRWLSRKINPS